MTVHLRNYTAADEAAALAAHAELAADGFEFLLDYHPGELWSGFVQRTLDSEQGLNLPETWVPAAQLAVDVDGELVGRASIRFGFNDFLAFRGGHIGYAIRPAFRRQGYATEVLRLSLHILREHDIDRALLTCDDTNAGSAAVIERNGGVLESVALDPDDGTRFRRYWIG